MVDDQNIQIETPVGFIIGGIVEGIIIFILNVSVIISVHQIPRNSKFRVTYILLGNLALTDASTGALLFIMQVIPDHYRTYYYCVICVGK